MPATQDYAHPQRTIRLLDELEPLGFDEEAFQTLHHGERVTIARHRDYCSKTGTFKDDRNNSHVQRRLEIVLRAFWAGGFDASKPERKVFHALAQAAVAQVPFEE